MRTSVFDVQGAKITIIEKPKFDVVGFTRPVNLDGGMISSFINELSANGQLNKLAETLQTPQQIWACLSDVRCAENRKYCTPCDLNCANFHTRCTVCVEKTDKHDFSSFENGELFMFSVSASKWALCEASDKDSAVNFIMNYSGVIKETGFCFDNNIGLHFDNQHECFVDSTWDFSTKKYYFLMPVTSIS
jgi:hypothetical protein